MSVDREERARMASMVAKIARDLGIPCKVEEPLGPHTTMGVGGPAPCFLEPSSAGTLAGLVRELAASGLPFRILGAGSNLIVDDRGLSTPVISTASLSGEPERRGESVRAPAGMLLPRLVRRMADEGLGGFEFLEGIPGSLGGSLSMNAGAGGRWIGDVVAEVETVTPAGEIGSHRPGQEEFGYRRSFVSQQGRIVTSATLRGRSDEPQAIRERIRDSRAYRVATQPLSERSSGCIFKNPDGDSAGALLDRLSLKGLSAGGAIVSERHANFIVNRGGSCDDILRLIDLMRERVRQQAGIDLQLEVVVWRDR